MNHHSQLFLESCNDSLVCIPGDFSPMLGEKSDLGLSFGVIIVPFTFAIHQRPLTKNFVNLYLQVLLKAGNINLKGSGPGAFYRELRCSMGIWALIPSNVASGDIQRCPSNSNQILGAHGLWLHLTEISFFPTEALELKSYRYLDSLMEKQCQAHSEGFLACASVEERRKKKPVSMIKGPAQGGIKSEPETFGSTA